MPSGDEALHLKAAPRPSGRDDRGADFNHNLYYGILKLNVRASEHFVDDGLRIGRSAGERESLRDFQRRIDSLD